MAALVLCVELQAGLSRHVAHLFDTLWSPVVTNEKRFLYVLGVLGGEKTMPAKQKAAISAAL